MDNIETMENVNNINGIEALEPLFEFIEMLITKYGSLGIAAAMFAESAGVPFASSLVLITAGTMILRGSSTFLNIFIASTLGITLGSIFSYWVGLLGSILGRVVKTNIFHYKKNKKSWEEIPASKSKARILELWKKHGNFSIFMAQLWGFTRTYISFPAGAMHMNLGLFIGYTFLGGAVFSLMTIGLSMVLTGAIGLILSILKPLAELSPWLLTIPAALVIIFIYIYFYRNHRLKFSIFSRLWGRFMNRFTRN
ncbi:MAG: DedA family protein [Bacillota bacterium]